MVVAFLDNQDVILHQELVSLVNLMLIAQVKQLTVTMMVCVMIADCSTPLLELDHLVLPSTDHQEQ